MYICPWCSLYSWILSTFSTDMKLLSTLTISFLFWDNGSLTRELKILIMMCIVEAYSKYLWNWSSPERLLGLFALMITASLYFYSFTNPGSQRKVLDLPLFRQICHIFFLLLGTAPQCPVYIHTKLYGLSMNYRIFSILHFTGKYRKFHTFLKTSASSLFLRLRTEHEENARFAFSTSSHQTVPALL